MKSLKQMQISEKGELLCRLFPEELENIQKNIKQTCEYFLENEAEFRLKWINNVSLTEEIWYRLVRNACKRIDMHDKRFFKAKHWFTKIFFDGYDVIFTIHCLLEYAKTEECNEKLIQAIHLLFGTGKILTINYEP